MLLKDIKSRLAALSASINSEMYEHLDDETFESHLEDLENLAADAQQVYDDEQAAIKDEEDDEDEEETEG